MKKLAIILIVIIVLVLVLSVGKNMIVKAGIEKGVKLVTGLQLRMGGLNIGIIKTLVGINNLKLYNPKGYQDKVMLNMPEVYVDYDLPAVFQGTVHLNEMRINLKEFMVVKNEKGELNLDSLKVVQAQKEGKAPEEKEKAKAPDIKIDSLNLKIGKVIYKDYSRGGTPSVREFNVNLDEKYENITNPYALVSLIVVKALMNTTIASLTNFDLGGLKGTVSDTLGAAGKIATETVTKVTDTVGETTEALSKTAGDLKDKFKLPFGN
ncbi:MAG: hypothetical protein HQ572_02325 [Candidatus Omnitrophica bacterium]|nr:hypothetical protein [Candidatus Omnitrophota bacterium]